MTFFELIHAHPVLTGFCALLVVEVALAVVKSCRRRKGP